MICLDTDIAIAILNDRPPAARRHLARAIETGEAIVLPAIVLYELAYGAAKSARPAENQARIEAFLAGPLSVLAFEDEDALRAGRLRAALEQAGTPIGPYDLLIAAQADRAGAALATGNRREFERIAGLVLLDWLS